MNSYILQIACRQPHGHELFKDSNFSQKFNKNEMSQPISDDGFTPLMIAVKHRRRQFVKILLQDRFCDKITLEKLSSDFERTVLHICAEFPDDSITGILIEKGRSWGINLAPTDVIGDTPLHICAQKNNLDMCSKLLSTYQNTPGSESNSKHPSNHKLTSPIQMLTMLNNNGLTAFHVAIDNGYNKIVEEMIHAVPDPKILIEERDEQLNTSLHKAALKGKFQVSIISLFSI